ncbi:PREDICTED: uncharacterized protein LOC108366981 isoform X3 [Rhagoletis zephyria]|uniref:uncharacterized protein LOC108366981 isoform X3 n=1 Tax=Rhagoletis zephyria TaxID=28612 RepID=UPI000811A5C5|nr:PREDICTED: uncharacterized protein LOC108366981 isoform X3 [Rhagoletis zephyria]XP_017476980.1 PREDICTED: uncharacterized protein LOC108366981 isoform X3 [Rhagoletis zephyria]XP_017476981.1 PREDICTED: uncharacterized protein LOC108366981 isoform X3 [Rhagoletis zephyria]
MTKLLDLNDDCLYCICSYLNLDDQLSMKNVCRHLNMVIKWLWRYRSKALTISCKQMKEFNEEGSQDFLDVMTSVCEILEKLTIDSIKSAQLKQVAHLRFPKLKFLECTISHDLNESNDADVLRLTKLCPYITRLVLGGGITGKYISNLFLLTDLDLSCCEYLDTEYLAEICNTLKLRKLALLYYGYNRVLDDGLSAITDCHTLEELKIDDHHLLLFIDELLRMPSMRKIVCYTRDYDVFLMGKLAQALGVRIHTLIFNCVLWSNDRHIEYIGFMTHLQRLILQDDDIEDEQLEVLAQRLKQLREFHFSSSRLESDNGILEIAKHCTKLEVLNLTKSNISSDFLRNIMIVLSEIKRNAPLKLYCGKTAVENEPIIENEQLIVSTEDLLFDLPYGRCLQCEW